MTYFHDILSINDEQATRVCENVAAALTKDPNDVLWTIYFDCFKWNPENTCTQERLGWSLIESLGFRPVDRISDLTYCELLDLDEWLSERPFTIGAVFIRNGVYCIVENDVESAIDHIIIDMGNTAYEPLCEWLCERVCSDGWKPTDYALEKYGVDAS